jgi:hypothetical protein
MGVIHIRNQGEHECSQQEFLIGRFIVRHV